MKKKQTPVRSLKKLINLLKLLNKKVSSILFYFLLFLFNMLRVNILLNKSFSKGKKVIYVSICIPFFLLFPRKHVLVVGYPFRHYIWQCLLLVRCLSWNLKSRLDNDELSPEQVNDVKDFIDDYVERNQVIIYFFPFHIFSIVSLRFSPLYHLVKFRIKESCGFHFSQSI